jgi:hypothetical protein
MKKANIVKEKHEADNFFSQNLYRKKKSKIKSLDVNEEKGYSTHQTKEKESVWFINDEIPKENVREIFVRPPTTDELKSDIITSAS